MRYALPIVLFVLSLSGCGGGSGGGESKQATAPAAAAPARTAVRPADETRHFPPADRVDVKIVDDKILGRDFLPGGNLATYKKGGAEYQMFLVKAKDTTEPALWLLDLKKQMTGAKLNAGFGGYYGMDSGKPLFAFTKNNYLAGVIGLSEKQSDSVARELAVRIP